MNQEKISSKHAEQPIKDSLFCVCSRIFVLFEPYVRFHIFSSVWVTEWPPIGE